MNGDAISHNPHAVSRLSSQRRKSKNSGAPRASKRMPTIVALAATVCPEFGHCHRRTVATGEHLRMFLAPHQKIGAYKACGVAHGQSFEKIMSRPIREDDLELGLQKTPIGELDALSCQPLDILSRSSS